MFKTVAKTLAATVIAISFGAAGLAFADVVHDWRDLFRVHNHVLDAIHELERARAANHYDMAGHGLKAEELLHQAEHELNLAVEAAKNAK